MVLPHKKLVQSISTTLAAQLGILPILAYFFHHISFFSFLTNLIILPIAGVIIILGFVTLIVSIISLKLASIPAMISIMLIKLLVVIAKFVSEISFGSFLVITPSIIVIIIYYLSLFTMISTKEIIKKNRKSWLYFFLSVLMLIQLSHILPQNGVEISFIDVGQGDSIFIQTIHHKKILIDGGGSKDEAYDVGEKVLLPYLLKRQVSKIDFMFLSHAHEDHMGGLLTVLEKMKVGTVIIGHQKEGDTNIERLLEVCYRKRIKVLSVIEGDSFEIDNVRFEVIYPNSHINAENLNLYSLVVKMECFQRSILFTGDIEEEGEKEITKNIDVDILKVAHHGAKTSSSKKFLEAVTPQISIISVAEKNIYRSS